LHYDFRLEHDGVLLSWAVPKGPSLSTRDKRLAVQVEDHPIDYRDFEGTIPEGQYGGGTVIVWDRGTWAPIGDPDEGLKKGHLDLGPGGGKLTGRFARVRTRGEAKRPTWLLIKRSDKGATPDANIGEARRESVLPGGTMEDIAAGVPAVPPKRVAGKRSS